MNRLTQLRHQYFELTNQVLPSLAVTRHFPVQHNHCFERIILDNLFGCCWYEVLNRTGKAAYRQLNKQQLEAAIVLAESIVAQPDAYPPVESEQLRVAR